MGRYVDGFLLPIAKDKVGEYMNWRRKPVKSGRNTARSNIAKASATIWK
jgi:hypothetical protein